MSTDAVRRRRFGLTFLLIAVLLAVAGLGTAAATIALGPRVTAVQFDGRAAVDASGSRMILTLSQAVEEVQPEQVTITPATDFTVDTSGRTVGVRFTLPLWDETAYTIRIDGVSGLGGGPDAVITETATTPALEEYLLLRGDDEDTIFRTGIDGEAAVPVFTDPHIEDFRRAGSRLVISTVDDDEHSRLVVTDGDGKYESAFTLPGEGRIANLQAADRGARIGYTFTDADLGAEGGRESVLYTASATDPDAEPTPIERADEQRVEDWRFVPGTDSVLMLTFDGALTLASTESDDPVALGNALHIHGIAPGSTVAVIETADGLGAIDLASSEPVPVPTTDPALGQVGAVTPMPGGDGSSLRVLSQLDGFSVASTSVALVDAAGEARDVFTLDDGDALLHTCVSASGRYAAVLVAPDIVGNAYDGYQLPLPEQLETHVISVADGVELVALTGFDMSWCETAPPL